jgi:hypothetical protein
VALAFSASSSGLFLTRRYRIRPALSSVRTRNLLNSPRLYLRLPCVLCSFDFTKTRKLCMESF